MTSEPPRESSSDERASMVGETLRYAFLQLRRVVIFVIGSTVVLIGVVMFFTPGPAIVVIPVGLGILAIEFAWARTALLRFKEKASKLGADVADRFKRDNDT